MVSGRFMRLLLDENVAEQLSEQLRAHGINADHTKSLDLNNRPDRTVLRFAVAQDYDAVVTKDRYRKANARLAALRAMRGGLRIIQLRFRQNALGAGSVEEQLRLILDHREQIEQALAPDSQIRRLIINAAINSISRTMTAAEVEAELRRLEAR